MTENAPGSVWLEVELLGDVFVSADGATTTTYSGIDDLRGSLLYGVAASALYKELGPDVFLGGRVQCGDGLRLAADGAVALPVPQVFYRGGELSPKTWRLFNAAFDGDEAAMVRRGGAAVERLRDGDVAWVEEGQDGGAQGGNLGLRWWRSPLELRLKSATDRDAFDRSMDKQLFGYPSLPAGLRFAVEIRAAKPDAGNALEKIAACLGPGSDGREVRLGRSKHKEFGRTRVRRMEKLPCLEMLDEHEHAAGARLLIIYLRSDVALFDGRTGHPTLDPLAIWQTSGESSDDIRYRGDLSRMAIRRYSPWNGHLNGRTAERQVLARGSVLVFEKQRWQRDDPFAAHARELARKGVGLYQAEGLGRIALNPRLVWESPDRIELQPHIDRVESSTSEVQRPDSLLLDALSVSSADEAAEKLAARWIVAWNEAVVNLETAGCAVPTASQWSRLRNAMAEAGSFGEIHGVLDDVCGGKRLGAQVWQQPIPPDDHSLTDIIQSSLKESGEDKSAREYEEHLALAISIAAAQMAKAART